MPKCVDIGELSGEVLVYGGPYSNLQALESLIAWADENGFEPSQRLCTGDIVAYCAQASECVALFRAKGGRTIKGNCELQLGTGQGDCGCGFDAGTACDLLSKGWFPHAESSVTDTQRAWMNGLPDWLGFRLNGLRYVVVHGGATNVSRFLWPVSANIEFRCEIEEIEAAIGPVDGVIAGHSGIAFERLIDGVHWINAGAIGMPQNDGNRQTRFATLGETGVRFHRLEYDVEAAFGAMQKAGLRQGYETCLRSGYWPSEDVLPAVMRRGPDVAT